MQRAKTQVADDRGELAHQRGRLHRHAEVSHVHCVRVLAPQG
jgi:hypothetical protein